MTDRPGRVRGRLRARERTPGEPDDDEEQTEALHVLVLLDSVSSWGTDENRARIGPRAVSHRARVGTTGR